MKRVSGIRRGIVRSLAAAAAAFALVTTPAEASIVERIVAVVGERPILLSELRQRARPHLFRIAQTTQNPTQAAAAESEMFRQLLTNIIDERLEEQAADKAHITVTPDEVDAAIRQVAGQAKLDPQQLLEAAKAQGGLSEQDYRDEMRRQVLDGKLIQLRVRGRVRISEQDARAAYARWVRDTAAEQKVDLQILVLAIPAGVPKETALARVTLAEELVRRARAGDDYCSLIKNYSDDPTTKNTCGSRGPVSIAQLSSPELQQAAASLKPGEISAPIIFKDPTGQQAILIVRTQTVQLETPAFEKVKEQMMEQAYIAAMERQKKLWLQELRRGLYIDVRL